MVSSIDMKMAQAAMLFSALMTGCAVDAVTPEEADLEQADVDVASSEQALEGDTSGDTEETRGGGLIPPGKTDLGGPLVQGPVGKGVPLGPGLGAPIQGPGQVPIGKGPVGQVPGGIPGVGPFGGIPGGGPFGGIPSGPFGGIPGGGLGPYGGLGGLGPYGGLGGLGPYGGLGGGLGGLGGLGGGLGGLGGGLGGLGGGFGFPGGGLGGLGGGFGWPGGGFGSPYGAAPGMFSP
ncbi:hypothetical protein [Sorangium sp. So ce861]|uniref:hypothetical protein n=1 Tax=Sorangium sp. So ce861 TaxID=3133323 RepID=UPI003F5E8D90